MKIISKSKYVSSVCCPKKFWLSCHCPEKADEIPAGVLDAGNDVGVFAHQLFDNVVDVTKKDNAGKIDVGQMIKETQKLINEGVEVIAEASFSNDKLGLFCSVDLLKNNLGGSFDIYEVKSSTDIKEIYYHDIAFQKTALESCGIKIKNCFIVLVNNKYVRSGDVNARLLFKTENVSSAILPYQKDVLNNVKIAQEIYDSNEPIKDLSINCHNPYGCEFYKYCSKHLPKNNIFDLYRMGKTKAFECYYNGIVSYEDIINSQMELSQKQKMQVVSNVFDLPACVDKPKIKDFLNEIKVPAYFLDFESWGLNTAIPLYDGQKPYQQIPFQYSIHILKDGDIDRMDHLEFLADENINPTREFAENLIRDVGDSGSIIVYNQSFEKTRIKELAKIYPDLKDKLLSLNERVVDLLDVFRNGYYYHKDFKGSFSIKKVLPVMCHHNPKYDYGNLKDVHNGSEASNAFLQLKNITNKKDRQQLRENLLCYCKLDTMAMAVIYKELCIQSLS